VNAGPFGPVRIPTLRLRHGNCDGSAVNGPGAARDDNFFRDRAEIGSKVHGALVHQNPHLLRLDAHRAIHVPVEELRPLAELTATRTPSILRDAIRPRSAAFPFTWGRHRRTSVRERFDFESCA